MQAQHLISSETKATTPSDLHARHLVAVRIVGTAIFEYQVRKTPAARIHLESVASMAQAQGDLTYFDALVVAHVLGTYTHSAKQHQEMSHA